jgi:hypothetical protein
MRRTTSILEKIRRSRCIAGIGERDFSVARSAMPMNQLKEGVWKRQ